MRSSTKELTREEVLVLGREACDREWRAKKKERLVVMAIGISAIVLFFVMGAFCYFNRPHFTFLLEPTTYQLPGNLGNLTAIVVDQGVLSAGNETLKIISGPSFNGNFWASVILAIISICVFAFTIASTTVGATESARASYAQAYVEAWLENDKKLPSSDWKPPEKGE